MEGELTEKKKEYIRNVTLTEAARRLRLKNYLLIEGNPDTDALTADTFEAVLGATLLLPYIP